MEFCREFVLMILEDKFLRNIFDNYVFQKFAYDGFINIKEYFDNRLGSKRISFQNRQPSFSIHALVSELKMQISIPYRNEALLDNQMIDLDEEDIVNLLKRIIQIIALMEEKYQLKNESKNRNELYFSIIFDFAESYLRERYKGEVFVDEQYICMNYIELVHINSLSEYLGRISNISINSGEKIFFRGHSNSNYQLLPSYLRTLKWFKQEDVFYHNIVRMCPKIINAFSSHIDRLVEMQHYELPTRLLDLSANSLVALLFASKDSKRYDGEVIVFKEKAKNIKYGNSDTVAIHASLPLFCYDKKQEILSLAKDRNISRKDFNEREIVQKLLHEIKTEKPAFRDNIDPADLDEKILFALPALLNDRIIKQSGAFIITGLVDYKNKNVISKKLNDMRYVKASSSKKPIYIVAAKCKEQILQDLELCDLSEATIFPEIDKVAQYLKNKK